MRKPITSSPKFKDKDFESFDKIASKLQANWPEVFKGPDEANGITIRSLGAKIGELDRGKATWWLKREAETECLIKLLEIDRDELGLHQKTGRHIFALPAFPDFPPLDLMREDYWKIAEPELLPEETLQKNDRYASKPTLNAWLLPQSKIDPIKKIEWLYVPDETEYQLLTRKLDAIRRYRFTSHNSLREAIDKDPELFYDQQPLILAIREKPDVGGMKKLINARQGEPLLVISPSPLPDLRPEKKTETKIDDQSKLCDQIKRDVNSWVWTLVPDWRAKLLQWLEQRLEALGIKEHSFSNEGTQKLLQKLDPRGKLIDRVEDVLALYQAMYEKGEIKLIEELEGGEDNADKLLLQLFNLEKLSPSSLMLLKKLIERRWKHPNLAWEGELDNDDWEKIKGDLCDFKTLLDQQLIVRGTGGGYDFQRPALIRLLRCEQLMAELNKGDLTTWPPTCFDNQRRPLGDAALDAINIDHLEQIAAQLIEALTSAETIGAGEALFAAIGRRIIREEDIGGELPKLTGHVLKQLTWDAGMLYPCSRPLENMTQVLEWICVCWAWSLTPSPGTNFPPNWYFPGWYPEELPQTVPDWLNAIASNFFSQDMTIPMRDFLSVVTGWLARHETPPTYEKMPPLFDAGLLARAAAGQWSAKWEWWYGLLNHPIAEQTLLNQVESSNPTVNRRTALAWWPSLVKNQRKKNSETGGYSRLFGSSFFTRNSKEQRYSVLLNWVMEQMEIHDEPVLTGLDDDDRKFLILHSAELPTSFKRQLLQSLAKDVTTDWHSVSFLNLFLDYGRETAEEMEMFLDNDALGDQAARCLWEWAPRKAERLLKKRDYNRKALRRLILFIPSSSTIGDAVALLKHDPALLSDKERRDWARRFLPDARQYAQDLLQLLNTQTEE